MKKWLLVFCLLSLSACGTEDVQDEVIPGQDIISEAEGKEIAMDVIKKFWQAYEAVGTQASTEEKREHLMPFMTEEMFNQAFEGTEKPQFPQLPVYTFGVHVTEHTPDSFTVEHILAASTEEGAAVKQTVQFVKKGSRFVVSAYDKEDTTLSLTKEEVEAFLAAHGYEAVFLKEGAFDAFSTMIEDAYIFQDQEEEQIRFVISKKTGFFMMGIVREAKNEEADPDDATTEEIRAKYAHLFTYRLAEMDADKLPAERQDIYNTYIIQPIEQAIDIDFDPSLTDEESHQQTKELLDQSVAGMLAEIESILDEKEFAILQESHEKWETERQKYAVEIAEASDSDQANHFFAAYKEVTEDYLGCLFYEYLY